MMYSATELRTLSIKPRINDISLKVLSEYYEIYLYPFIYQYHTKSKEGEKELELRFDLENFCHLLGIESTVKYAVPMRDLHNYKGKDGWCNVSEQRIDISFLKSINKRKFSSMKAKYVYFYLLPELIEKPMAVNYKKENVDPTTSIDCEILFYSKVTNDNAIIHLGIERGAGQYYFPRTFFVEKVSETENDIYIANQEEISVTVKSKMIML